MLFPIIRLSENVSTATDHCSGLSVPAHKCASPNAKLVTKTDSQIENDLRNLPAGNARKKIEQETRNSVITSKNSLDFKKLINNVTNNINVEDKDNDN